MVKTAPDETWLFKKTVTYIIVIRLSDPAFKVCLFGLLTVSHEPICTGLTKVALSAGRQSDRNVCGDRRRQITTDGFQHKDTHLHAAIY